jgi:hypothetical protein
MNCEQKRMAKKMNVSKFAHEVRNATAHQRSPSHASALYPIPPRPQPLKIYPPKRRLQITLQLAPAPENPEPVKITHAD